MEEKPEKKVEIDRSKLKSFRDLSTLTGRGPYVNRRPKTARRSNFVSREPLSGVVPDRLIPIRNQLRVIPRKISPHIYRINRQSTMKLSGYRHDFQLYFGDEPMYHAKVKPYSSLNQIGIAEGTTSHISSSNFEGVLLHANSFMDFSLRKQSTFGDELMSFSFKKDPSVSKPRDLSVTFYRHPPSVPDHMNSVEPSLTAELEWEIDLKSSKVIPSIKNCRLEDDQKRNYIIIRKISEDDIEVETTLNVSAMYSFALAIGSFLCK